MLSIRPAGVEDAPTIYGFVCDLADYEHARDQVQLTEQDYTSFLQEGGHFNAVIAEIDERAVGMAIWYNRFSTWVGDYMHLEDLYVDPNTRGQGVGSQLLKHLASTALDLGLKRMEWQVLDWNEPAIKRYRNIGAQILHEWQLFQMDQQSLTTFVNPKVEA